MIHSLLRLSEIKSMVSVAYNSRIVCDVAFLKWLYCQTDKRELFRRLMFIKASSQNWRKEHNIILESELSLNREMIDSLDDGSIGAAFRILPNPSFLSAYKDQISKNINFAIELANDTPYRTYLFTTFDQESVYKSNKHFSTNKITSVEIVSEDKARNIINDFFEAFKRQRDSEH